MLIITMFVAGTKLRSLREHLDTKEFKPQISECVYEWHFSVPTIVA